MIGDFHVEQGTLEETSYPVVDQLKAEQLRDHTKMYVAYLFYPPIEKKYISLSLCPKYDKFV